MQGTKRIKLPFDFNSVYEKFLIENLMKGMKHPVREKHVFDYDINPNWYQFLEFLDNQQSDDKINRIVFQPNFYLELMFFMMNFWKQKSL